MPPQGMQGRKLRVLLRARTHQAARTIMNWARMLLNQRKEKLKAEVVARIDRFLAEVPPEEAKVLARQMRAQLAASLRASGELSETPQVIYFTILPIASPDWFNAHTLHPQAPSVSSGAESSEPVFSPDAPGPVDQVIADHRIAI